jgi:hypothetical protein
MTGLREIEVAAAAAGPDGIRLSWHSFGREVSAAEIAGLHREQDTLLQRMDGGAIVTDELAALGRRLGQILVGEENAAGLLKSFGEGFTLFRVTGDPTVQALAWEALQIPGTDAPLLFLPEMRGRADFARDHPVGEPAGRRVENKVLASISLAKELLVEREVKELRDRFLRHPGVRFRWVLHPDLGELLSRLSLECSLFLHAGHGELLGDGRYEILLRSGRVDVRELLPGLLRSRAEMLIFDACDSGRGLPSLFAELPSATCLLGMQGPTDDSVSCWHMPALVDRLFLGEPVWKAVSLLRTLLYEQGSDLWFIPVIHLKRSYRPFATARGVRSYLEGLRGLVRERQGRAGPRDRPGERSSGRRCSRSTA